MIDCDMTITWLRSLRTGRSFPVAVFCGDTDMATAGLIALSSTSGSEIAVAVLTPAEIKADESAASRLVEERVNARLNRSDFRYVPLLRSVRHGPQPAMSFQEFRASNHATELFYGDLYDAHGEAVVERDETLAKFRNAGGLVTYVT